MPTDTSSPTIHRGPGEHPPVRDALKATIEQELIARRDAGAQFQDGPVQFQDGPVQFQDSPPPLAFQDSPPPR
jgi:hypothetical protein